MFILLLSLLSLLFIFTGLYQLVTSLRNPINHQKIIDAPSFDHAIGDPIENDIKIFPRFIIIFSFTFLLLSLLYSNN